MEIKQNAQFTPIVITLESQMEAEALWEVIEERIKADSVQVQCDGNVTNFCSDLSSWFSNNCSFNRP